MFDYDVESSKAVDELDKHDLTDVLKNIHGEGVYEVAEQIRDLGNLEVTKAVDTLTEDEFVLYLERRYKMKSMEEVRNILWWGKDKRKDKILINKVCMRWRNR